MSAFQIFMVISGVLASLVVLKMEPTKAQADPPETSPKIQVILPRKIVPVARHKAKKKHRTAHIAESWIVLDPGTYVIDGKRIIVTEKSSINLHGKTPWIVPRE